MTVSVTQEQEEKGATMKLVYIPREGFACPSDGWPASDHDEPDKKLAAEKVKSGWYREEKQASQTPKTTGAGDAVSRQ